ncbi:hypothetical protein TCAL_16800 [Tigriopus californicus]|uniref:C2H2-type domain-containing protein n=1 Tax=Tigriopus californicus TaxID=6832 RepID=A0A553PBM9_TIGCA|nr:hypothetical protein TCAL_16800 [Tigriopus californicus]
MEMCTNNSKGMGRQIQKVILGWTHPIVEGNIGHPELCGGQMELFDSLELLWIPSQSNIEPGMMGESDVTPPAKLTDLTFHTLNDHSTLSSFSLIWAIWSPMLKAALLDTPPEADPYIILEGHDQGHIRSFLDFVLSPDFCQDKWEAAQSLISTLGIHLFPITAETPGPPKSKFKCDTCQEAFKGPGGLRQHFKSNANCCSNARPGAFSVKRKRPSCQKQITPKCEISGRSSINPDPEERSTQTTFHDDRLESGYQILVGLASVVAVRKLVPIAFLEVLGELLLDLCIGHPVTRPRINLIQGLPPLLDPVDVFSGLNGSSHPRGPYLHFGLLKRVHEQSELAGKLDAIFRQVRIAPNAALDVEFRLAVTN